MFDSPAPCTISPLTINAGLANLGTNQPATGSPRSYQCAQGIYMALPTYTWYVHDVEVYCPIRHASGVITEIRFHVSKLSDFDNRMKKMAFLRCPAQLYGFRSEILTIQTFIPIRSMMCSRHFSGFVLIGREQPHCCRRLSAPSAIYTLPATCFSTSRATTVEKSQTFSIL